VVTLKIKMASEEQPDEELKIGTKKKIVALLFILISLIYFTHFTWHLQIETTNSILVHFDRQMAEDIHAHLLHQSEEATSLRKIMGKRRQHTLYKTFQDEKINVGNYRLKFPFIL